VRGSLLWHVSSAFDATLSYQWQDDHANAFSRQTDGLSYTDAAYIPIAPDHRVVDLTDLTLTGDLGFATITSSTSYTRNQDLSSYDESPFLLSYNAISPQLYGNYPRATTEFFTNYSDRSYVEELRLVSKAGGAWDYTVGGFFRRQINDLYQYETVPGFAAWSELPGSANAVNQYNLANGLGLPAYANFADYLQQYNGGTRPSALSPIDENYTYARNSGFKDRALYGELTRHLTPEWQVTGGARVFWQNVDESWCRPFPTAVRCTRRCRIRRTSPTPWARPSPPASRTSTITCGSSTRATPSCRNCAPTRRSPRASATAARTPMRSAPAPSAIRRTRPSSSPTP